MTEAQIALARRAVACRGWRWMAGMLAAGHPGPRGGQKRARVEGILTLDDWTPRCVDFRGRRVPAHYACKCSEEEVMPDLTDPATLGCLLALVREATTAYASLTFEPGYLDTEIENLVAALEAAS